MELISPPPRGLMPHTAPPRSAAARAPVPVAATPMLSQETLTYSKAGLAQSLWGLWVLVLTRFYLAL